MSENTEAVDLLLGYGANILKLTKNGENVEDMIRIMDPNLEKACSQYIMAKYLAARSQENQIILLQVLESPAI